MIDELPNTKSALSTGKSILTKTLKGAVNNLVTAFSPEGSGASIGFSFNLPNINNASGAAEDNSVRAPSEDPSKPSDNAPYVEKATPPATKIDGENIVKSLEQMHKGIVDYLGVIESNNQKEFSYLDKKIKGLDATILKVSEKTDLLQKKQESALSRMDREIRDIKNNFLTTKKSPDLNRNIQNNDDAKKVEDSGSGIGLGTLALLAPLIPLIPEIVALVGTGVAAYLAYKDVQEMLKDPSAWFHKNFKYDWEAAKKLWEEDWKKTKPWLFGPQSGPTQKQWNQGTTKDWFGDRDYWESWIPGHKSNSTGSGKPLGSMAPGLQAFQSLFGGNKKSDSFNDRYGDWQGQKQKPSVGGGSSLQVQNGQVSGDYYGPSDMPQSPHDLIASMKAITGNVGGSKTGGGGTFTPSTIGPQTQNYSRQSSATRQSGGGYNGPVIQQKGEPGFDARGLKPELAKSLMEGSKIAFGDPSDPKTRYVVTTGGGGGVGLGRPGGSFHNKGLAIDVQIYDRQTKSFIGGSGDIMKNAFGNPQTYRQYEVLAQAQYQYNLKTYGKSEADKYSWGGRFGSSMQGTGPDEMHYSYGEGGNLGPITGPVANKQGGAVMLARGAKSEGMGSDPSAWQSPYRVTVDGQPATALSQTAATNANQQPISSPNPGYQFKNLPSEMQEHVKDGVFQSPVLPTNFLFQSNEKARGLDSALKASLTPEHYQQWQQTGRLDPSILSDNEYNSIHKNSPTLAGGLLRNAAAQVSPQGTTGTASMAIPNQGTPQNQAAQRFTPQEGSGQWTGFAKDRQKFQAEIENNPALKEKIMRIMQNEQGAHPQGAQGVLESMMNRASVKGVSLEHEATWKTQRGYYDDRRSPGGYGVGSQSRAIYEQAFKNAFSGQDTIGGAYDNASGSFAEGEATSGDWDRRQKLDGESFLVGVKPGAAKVPYAKWQQWYAGMKGQGYSDAQIMGMAQTSGSGLNMWSDKYLGQGGTLTDTSMLRMRSPGPKGGWAGPGVMGGDSFNNRFGKIGLTGAHDLRRDRTIPTSGEFGGPPIGKGDKLRVSQDGGGGPYGGAGGIYKTPSFSNITEFGGVPGGMKNYNAFMKKVTGTPTSAEFGGPPAATDAFQDRFVSWDNQQNVSNLGLRAALQLHGNHPTQSPITGDMENPSGPNAPPPTAASLLGPTFGQVASAGHWLWDKVEKKGENIYNSIASMVHNPAPSTSIAHSSPIPEEDIARKAGASAAAHHGFADYSKRVAAPDSDVWTKGAAPVPAVKEHQQYEKMRGRENAGSPPQDRGVKVQSPQHRDYENGPPVDQLGSTPGNMGSGQQRNPDGVGICSI